MCVAFVLRETRPTKYCAWPRHFDIPQFHIPGVVYAPYLGRAVRPSTEYKVGWTRPPCVTCLALKCVWCAKRDNSSVREAFRVWGLEKRQNMTWTASYRESCRKAEDWRQRLVCRYVVVCGMWRYVVGGAWVGMYLKARTSYFLFGCSNDTTVVVANAVAWFWMLLCALKKGVVMMMMMNCILGRVEKESWGILDTSNWAISNTGYQYLHPLGRFISY